MIILLRIICFHFQQFYPLLPDFTTKSASSSSEIVVDVGGNNTASIIYHRYPQFDLLIDHSIVNKPQMHQWSLNLFQIKLLQYLY